MTEVHGACWHIGLLLHPSVHITHSLFYSFHSKHLPSFSFPSSHLICAFPLVPPQPFLLPLSLSLLARSSPVDVLRPVIRSPLSNIRFLISFLRLSSALLLNLLLWRPAVTHVSGTQYPTVNTQACAHLHTKGHAHASANKYFYKTETLRMHADTIHSNTEACISALFCRT